MGGEYRLAAYLAQDARVAALRQAADWLEDKAAKSNAYPGGDLKHAEGRAAAYLNASQEIRYWQRQAEDALPAPTAGGSDAG